MPRELILFIPEDYPLLDEHTVWPDTETDSDDSDDEKGTIILDLKFSKDYEMFLAIDSKWKRIYWHSEVDKAFKVLQPPKILTVLFPGWKYLIWKVYLSRFGYFLDSKIIISLICYFVLMGQLIWAITKKIIRFLHVGLICGIMILGFGGILRKIYQSVLWILYEEGLWEIVDGLRTMQDGQLSELED